MHSMRCIGYRRLASTAGSFHKYLSPAQDIRAKMREMGDLSEVPIEPKEQTALLDACVSQAGVIGGGVPGGET
jgi:phosphomevalonate kinase